MSRRFAQVLSDKDDVPASRSNVRKSRSLMEADQKRREDDDPVEKEEEPVKDKPDKAKPIGESVRVSVNGKERRTHFTQFEYDGNKYELEDSVLFNPENDFQKPYAAIIKDITQTEDGSMMILVQWFYRPEDAKKKGGGSWPLIDTRELFYSFHRDEVLAESVMHRCVVHFVPAHKQLPKRKSHRGFIVQKVYDFAEKKLRKLTDSDYQDSEQHEIDLLVEKTMSRVGDLPDLEI